MEHVVIKFQPCAFTPTFEREREREPEREREREPERETERQSQRERERETESERDRETERKRERQWGQGEGTEAPTYLQKKEE